MTLSSRFLRGIVTAFASAALALGGAVPALAATPQVPGHLAGARPAQADITAVFHCNDGGTYYVRQVGNQLWWYGESGDGGRSWSNVFNGTISGDTVQGNWADVPKGATRNSGYMTLRINGSNLFYATYQTGGFGGSVWWS